MKAEFCKTWIEIDAKTLLGNIKLFDDYVGRETALMLVIKANAYGHGLKEVALMLKRARIIHMLGVDSLDEALLVRSYGVKNPIMILGYIPPSRFIEAVRNGFHVSIYNHETLHAAHAISKSKKNNDLFFHLKIETGTNRLGIQYQDIVEKSLPPIYGLYTHFAEAENIHSRFYKEQMKQFEVARRFLEAKGIEPHVVHMGATSALVHLPESRGVLTRLGLGLYGLWPSEELKKKYQRMLPIRPVLSWKTKLAQVKIIQKGETVGYDRTYRAKSPMNTGVIPVGYYDGYPRALSGKGIVLVGGKRCPIIGRICMNMMMVDVSSTHARANDEVVLIGNQKKASISVDEVAERAGTINYEIIARLGPLTPKIIV